MGRLVLIRTGALVALLAAAGCGKHLNPAFCAANPDDPDCGSIDASLDGDSAGSNVCTRNDECASGVCLPAGTCGTSDEILYASPTGNGVACTSEMPCMLQSAIGLATPARHIILLAAGTYPGPFTIDRSVLILGQSAMLTGTNTTSAVTIADGVQVELDYATITGSGLAGGINCVSGAMLVGRQLQISGNALGVSSKCTLTLERSIIANNLAGALSLTGGVIDIHSSFIVNNGKNTFSGAVVDVKSSVTGSLSWNTIAHNQTSNAHESVECAATLQAVGNLITDNRGTVQASGTCDFTMSNVVMGAGPTANDVMWVNPDMNDFHLTSGSPVIDKATAVPCTELDFDGMQRPVGSACDWGADELGP